MPLGKFFFSGFGSFPPSDSFLISGNKKKTIVVALLWYKIHHTGCSTSVRTLFPDAFPYTRLSTSMENRIGAHDEDARHIAIPGIFGSPLVRSNRKAIHWPKKCREVIRIPSVLVLIFS